MPNFVQQYRSTDQSSWPTLTGEAGKLIALLDAILVNGGTTQSVTGITESGTTYTATIGSDATLRTGTYVTISGGSPAGVNVTAAITVVSPTSFTFQGPGSLGTITGTILYKRTGLGWTKPYTDTNLAAFLPQVVTGMPQFYLRIDETGGTAGGQKECAVRGYETMTDVSNGTGLFPTVAQDTNGLCWRKSTTADTTARSWSLFGDGSTFYIVMNSDNSTTLGRAISAFGGFPSYKVSDAYNCLIAGARAFNTGTVTAINGATATGFAAVTTMWTAHVGTTGLYAARSYSQTGTAVGLMPVTLWATQPLSNYFGNTTSASLDYPGPVDAGLWAVPGLFTEATTVFRGRPPGLYMHIHKTQPFAEFDTATNVLGLSGVTLTAISSSVATTSTRCLFDTYGPWT